MKKKSLLFTAILVVLFLSPFCVYSTEILGIYFPPYEGAEKPIIQAYDKAEKYIHLAIYGFTKEDITEALVRAHKRGVEVKVLMDKSQAKDSHAQDKALEAAGVTVRRSTRQGMMHNKFCVIDGIIIYTGSYNHTAGGTKKNDENYIIIKDKETASKYEHQFQRLWEKHK